MAKKKPPATPPVPNVPDVEPSSSETVRLATDLLEKVRDMCFHRRDSRNRRLKVTQYLDAVLRPLIERDYEVFLREQEAKKGSDEGPKDKGEQGD